MNNLSKEEVRTPEEMFHASAKKQWLESPGFTSKMGSLGQVPHVCIPAIVELMEEYAAQFKSPSPVQTEEVGKPNFEKTLEKSAFKSHPLNTHNDVISVTTAEYLMDEFWDKYVTPLQARIKELEGKQEVGEREGWISAEDENSGMYEV